MQRQKAHKDKERQSQKEKNSNGEKNEPKRRKCNSQTIRERKQEETLRTILQHCMVNYLLDATLAQIVPISD